MVSLDDLAKQLTRKKIDDMTLPIREARVAHNLPSISASNWEDFTKYISGYVQDHFLQTEQRILDNTEALGLAIEYLNNAFYREAQRTAGVKNGTEYAFKHLSNNQMDEVLNGIRTALVSEREKSHSTGVMGVVDPLDYPEHKNIAIELVEKLTPFLPEGRPPEDPAALAHKYEENIRTYTNIQAQAADSIGKKR